METSKKIPTFDQLMNPLIKALRELGGSGTTDEIYERVVEILKLPDEVLEVLHGSKGAQTEIAWLAWARTYLKKYGVLDNSARGVWALAAVVKDLEKVNPREVVTVGSLIFRIT